MINEWKYVCLFVWLYYTSLSGLSDLKHEYNSTLNGFVV